MSLVTDLMGWLTHDGAEQRAQPPAPAAAPRRHRQAKWPRPVAFVAGGVAAVTRPGDRVVAVPGQRRAAAVDPRLPPARAVWRWRHQPVAQPRASCETS